MLRKGSRGTEVSELQSMLNQIIKVGPLLKVDGVFGPKTRARVVRFQRSISSLPNTGVVDDATFDAMLDRFAAVLRKRGIQIQKEEAKVREQRMREQRRNANLRRTIKPKDVSNLIRTHSKDLPLLQNLMGGLGMNNLRQWLSDGVDISKALNLLGSLDAIAGAAYSSTSSVALTAGMNVYGTGAITSTASVAVGSIIAGSTVMLGNLLFLLKCASIIIGIYQDAQLTYALRGMAYAMTAWVFDKPLVSQSKKVLSNSVSITTEELPLYHKAWQDGQNAMLKHLNGMRFAGLTSKEFKQAMQVIYANNHQGFCLDVMRALTPRVPAGPNRDGWTRSIQAGTAYTYPN